MEYNIKLYARDGTYKKTLENNLTPIVFSWEINKGIGTLSLQISETEAQNYKQSDIIQILAYDGDTSYPIYSWELQEPSIEEWPDSIIYKLECKGLWTIITNYRMQNDFLLYPWFTLTLSWTARDCTIGILANMIVDKVNELHEWSGGGFLPQLLQVNFDNVDENKKITVPNKFTSDTISLYSYLERELQKNNVDFYIDATGTLYLYDTIGTHHKTTLWATVNKITAQGGNRTVTKQRFEYSRYYKYISWSISTDTSDYITRENTTASVDIWVVEWPLLNIWEYTSYEVDGGYPSEPTEIATAVADEYLQRSYERRRNIDVEINNQYQYYNIQPWHTLTVKESITNIQKRSVLQVKYNEYKAIISIDGYDNIWDLIVKN